MKNILKSGIGLLKKAVHEVGDMAEDAGIAAAEKFTEIGEIGAFRTVATTMFITLAIKDDKDDFNEWLTGLMAQVKKIQETK